MKEKNYCLNCEKPFTDHEEYCSNCGQHRLSGNLSAKHIFTELFYNVFNLDSRFFNTVKNLWRPHFLAKEYISGRRKSYLVPTQTLLFSVFFLYTIILLNLPSFNDLTKKSAVLRGEMLSKRNDFDSLGKIYVADTSGMDSLRIRLFGEVTDSFYQFTNIFSNKTYGITMQDISSLPADSIIAKKNIESWVDRTILRQYIKYIYNPIGSTKFLISSSSWAFILTIILMSIFAKLMYYRHDMYLIEHLTFNMYLHSSIFLLMGLIWEVKNYFSGENWGEGIFIFGITLIFLFIPWNISRFYKNGWIKSLIKFFLLTMTYFIVYLACGLIVALVSLLFI